MQKLCAIVISIGLLLLPLTTRAEEVEAINEIGENTQVVEGDSPSLIANAKSGILMEATTGKILFEKNPDEQISVASMTKMMSQILILEEVEKGSLSWDEKLTISSNASGMGGSQIWLETGEVMSVRDLMKGVSMASANDVVVVKKQSSSIPAFREI